MQIKRIGLIILISFLLYSSLANADWKFNPHTGNLDYYEPSGGGGGGATTFLNLTDTPSSYSGQAGKYVKVKSTENGLEFDTPSGSGDITVVGSCVSGDCFIDGTNHTLTFEGSTNDTIESILGATDPTGGDQIFNLPDKGTAGTYEITALGQTIELGTETTGIYDSDPSDDLTTSTNFSGDVTGTYNTIVVTDDSHNHTSTTLPANISYLGSSIQDSEVDDNITLTNITQITNRSHTSLSDIGTNTHSQIDTFIASKGQASGLASLDASSKVVQDPANATSTPTASKIPIADASGKLDGWITLGSSIEDNEIPASITRDTEWDTWAEHPSLTSGYILVGNASNQATAVAVTGDGSISNTGVLTVNDDSHSHTASTLPANTSYLDSSIESSEITDGTIQDSDIGSSEDVRVAQIHFDIDGGGSTITTGAKAWVRVPFNMTITGWDITANEVCSITVDIYKSNYDNAPPTTGSIAGSEKPTLSSAQRNQDTSLTTWNTSITKGQYIRANVDSVSGCTKCSIDIYGNKE